MGFDSSSEHYKNIISHSRVFMQILFCTSYWIRTSDPQIRNLVLYPLS